MFKLFKKKKAKKEQTDSKIQKSNKNDDNKENSPANVVSKDVLVEDKAPIEEQQQQNVEMQYNEEQGQLLTVDCNVNVNANESSCQASPSVFSESHNHLNHYRSSQLSTTVSGDLNRYLTSGYLTGDEDLGYLKRNGVDLKTPKSPHFHRPENFSYSHQPRVISPHANRSSSNSRGLLTSTLTSVNHQVKKIRHSTSTSTSPKRNVENEEPIRLSKFSGGYEPDPNLPAKIESLDWPSPPYPPAVPELNTRSRSSSNHQYDNGLQDSMDSSSQKEKPTKKRFNHKVYDDDFMNYTYRFTNHRSAPSTITTATPQTQQNVESTLNDVDIDDVDTVVKNPKLKRDIDEISKLEQKSGMAKLFGIELKAQEKVMERPLDPWKASRTPSANYEPIQRTRFETPVNASPSRVLCCCNKIPVTIYEDGICSTCGLVQQQQQQHQGSSTCVSTPTRLCSTPRRGATMPKLPKPGYTQSTNTKATTLPNSSRYYGMNTSNLVSEPTHRSVDFESNALTTGSYYAENGETPIVCDKIYPYSELRLGFKKKLPTDVDRERLEIHLNSEDLMKLFGVDTLAKFYDLPEWKRVELKKKAKLF